MSHFLYNTTDDSNINLWMTVYMTTYLLDDIRKDVAPVTVTGGLIMRRDAFETRCSRKWETSWRENLIRERV